MSLVRHWEWKCDECGRAVPEDGELSERDVLMPEGWIHTMMGDDLCQWCQK